MRFIRTTLCVVFLALALTATATAQTKSKKSPYVPKHEITLSASIGYNSFVLGGKHTTGAPIRAEDWLDEFSYGAIFFPFGVGYTYHFNKNWGIYTGLDAQACAAGYDDNGYHYNYIYDGTYPMTVAQSSNPNRFDPSQMTELYTEYGLQRESHSITGLYLNIPVMAQYLLPFGGGKWNFYAQGGVKLGIFLYGEANTRFSSDVEFIHHGIYTYNSKDYTYISEPETMKISGMGNVYYSNGEKEFNPVNLFAALEAGIRIPVASFFGIYVGGYADLGLVRATKRSPVHMYQGGERPLTSIFSAREEKAVVTSSDNFHETFTVTNSKRPYIKGVLPVSAGFKIRFAL